MRSPNIVRTSIVTRIALAGAASLLLFAIAMIVFVSRELQQTIYAQTDARVQVAENTMFELIREKGNPTFRDGTLRLGKWVANADNALVDHVRALTGADATLFAVVDGRPIRVTTTIIKLDGSGRNIGTELVGPARRAFDVGENFAGVSPVAGRPFLNRYATLRDRSGRVVGIAYTGIPLTAMQATVARAMRIVVVGTCVALAASLCLLYLVMRPLRRALSEAVAIARGLADGDVEQKSNFVSSDELGAMSRAFGKMIAYQQRMASIADALADGDFSTAIEPVSERDRLGTAFAHMSAKLESLVVRLEHSAMTDSLTQLGNRRAFEQRLLIELSRAARINGAVWLALIDVDDFKSVNDDNGHQHGDMVLSRLGDILRRVRAEDGAYRLGGDEFAIVFADCSAEQVLPMAERIRVAAQTELGGATVSVGLAVSPAGLIDGETLQRQADAALYACKQRGRNISLRFSDVKAALTQPQRKDVRSVVEFIEHGSMTVAFQPIWDLARGAILGFEALTRPDASYGLTGPAEAFAIAAKIGRAHDLDRLCRRAAIADAAALAETALIFLNVSPETLAREALQPEELAQELATAGIAFERVVLEITERYSGPLDTVIAGARHLQRFGFKLALDDTGAGNAGLEFLSRLTVDYIKIDGGIIAKAPHDSAARGVIGAIVTLARSSGAYVIAEGIEDAAMLDFVRDVDGTGHDSLGSIGVQGYYLGRPAMIGVDGGVVERGERLLRTAATS